MALLSRSLVLAAFLDAHAATTSEEVTLLQGVSNMKKLERTKPGEHAYLGCFVDDGARDFDHGPGAAGGVGYTFATCEAACSGYPFMALQYGGECFCDNTYGDEPQYDQVDDSECGMQRQPCSDESHLCGAAWRQAVYALNLPAGYVDTIENIHDEIDGLHEHLHEIVDVGSEILYGHEMAIEELAFHQYLTSERIETMEDHFRHAILALRSAGIEEFARVEAEFGDALAELHQLGVEALDEQDGRIDGIADDILSLEEEFAHALVELHDMGVAALANQAAETGAALDDLAGAMVGLHESQDQQIADLEEHFNAALGHLHDTLSEWLNGQRVQIEAIQNQMEGMQGANDIQNARLDGLEQEIDDLRARVETLEGAEEPPEGLPLGQQGVFNGWAATAGVHMVSGDFNGDGHIDVALIGGPGWGSIPVAHSRGNGRFSVTNCGVPSMNHWEDAAGAVPLVGDFNGDGKDDIALTAGQGWGSLPVAFSTEYGCFTVTNHGLGNFPTWAATANVKVVAGDFDGDGKADVAAIGNGGWGSLPTAFSNGDGTFRVTNHGLGGHFNQWSAAAGVYVLAGDFNGDGKKDVALIGGPGWGSIPVATSAGDGTYNSITNCGVHAMNHWIDAAGARPLVGDFNGDGKDDIALSGGHGWGSLPVAFATENGCFQVTNHALAHFPGWAATGNVQLVAGDINGDGKADVAAIGNGGWGTLPVAFSGGDGRFDVTNHGI